MRLSLSAARSAAFLPSRCVNTSLRTIHASTSTRTLPTIRLGSIRNESRRVAHAEYASIARTPKDSVTRKEQRHIAVKALEREIEDDPGKVLSDEERSLRHDYQHHRFANLMRTVPNPVAIVTTRRQDIDDQTEPLIGATISSFKTVSMKPEPYVSFNLAQGSRTCEIIKEHKYFCITIPQNDNAGAKLAKIFARTGQGIKEALKAENDGTQINAHHWKLALEYGSASDMKYPPPAVTASYVKGAKTNGLAFAFVCEYHDSIVVGDHVLITGKLLPATIASASPWGRDDEFGDSFSTSYLTLTYAHGVFGNPENLGGLDHSWKQDDKWNMESLQDLPLESQKNILKFYENRLRVIDDVRRARRGPITNSDPFPTKDHKRANLLRPAMLDKYREYYQSRLLKLHAIMKPSQATEDENPLAKVKETIGPFKPTEAPANGGAATTRKSLASLEQLEREERIYTARLEALNWLEPEQSDPSGATQSEEVNPNSVTWSTMAVKTKEEKAADLERSRLIKYFQQRLESIRQAKRQKTEALVHPESSRSNFNMSTTQDERDQMIRRYIGDKKSSPLPTLIYYYRQTQIEITETRLARIQCLYQDSQYDEQLMNKLEERLIYFEQRLDLLATIISAKYENGDQKILDRKLTAVVKRWDDLTDETSVVLRKIQTPFPGETEFRKITLTQDENDKRSETSDDLQNVKNLRSDRPCEMIKRLRLTQDAGEPNTSYTTKRVHVSGDNEQ